MPIVHVLIARGTTVLAEFGTSAGGVPTACRVILSRDQTGPGVASLDYDGHRYCVDSAGGITAMCVQTCDGKADLAALFLSDVRARFLAAFEHAIAGAGHGDMTTEFRPTLQGAMDFYNADNSALRGQMRSERTRLISSMDKLLERGERMELLVDHDDGVVRSAARFQYRPEQVQPARRRRTRRRALAIGTLLVVALAYVIVGATCGWAFGCVT